jgi:hypothetical protein
MRRKPTPAREHLLAIEEAVRIASEPPTTQQIADMRGISSKRASEYLLMLVADKLVHSIPSGLAANGKAWAIGPAPLAPMDYDEVDSPNQGLPIRQIINSTWTAIRARDPLVAALFGAPEEVAA